VLLCASPLLAAETATAPSHPASNHAAASAHPSGARAPTLAPVYQSPAALHAPAVVAVAPRPAPIAAARPASTSTFAAGPAHPATTPTRSANAWPNGAYGYSYGYGRPGYYTYVPVLPAYATLVWWNGVPYYAADDNYYVWNDGVSQYQVVPPPVDLAADAAPVAAAAPTPTAQVYTYPAAGQTPEQQQLDRYECYRWAVSQTGFDPSRGLDGAPPAAVAEAQGAYQRAELACLVGRGYRTG
jgi:hypothetical protein